MQATAEALLANPRRSSSSVSPPPPLPPLPSCGALVPVRPSHTGLEDHLVVCRYSVYTLTHGSRCLFVCTLYKNAGRCGRQGRRPPVCIVCPVTGWCVSEESQSAPSRFRNTVLLRFKTQAFQSRRESYVAYRPRPAAQLLSVHPG